LFYFNKDLKKSKIYYFKNFFIYFYFFEKYIFEININRFRIRVIIFAINIGVEEIL